MSNEVVPQFYYPRGKPTSEEMKQQNRTALETVFGQKKALVFSDFEQLCKEAFMIPTIFTRMLFDSIKSI